MISSLHLNEENIFRAWSQIGGCRGSQLYVSLCVSQPVENSSGEEGGGFIGRWKIPWQFWEFARTLLSSCVHMTSNFENLFFIAFLTTAQLKICHFLCAVDILPCLCLLLLQPAWQNGASSRMKNPKVGFLNLYFYLNLHTYAFIQICTCTSHKTEFIKQRDSVELYNLGP